MTHPQRRAMDNNKFDINSMIAEENDPRQRAFLIVLNSINNSLIANTTTTMEVAVKLDEHLTHYEQHTSDEAALINKGIGAWKVVAWASGIAQALMVAGGTYLVNDLKDIHTALNTIAVRDADYGARLAAVEEKKRDVP